MLADLLLMEVFDATVARVMEKNHYQHDLDL